MSPTDRELTFIVRFREQAAQALNRVRESLRGLGQSVTATGRQMQQAGVAIQRMQQNATVFAQGTGQMSVATRQATSSIAQMQVNMQALAVSLQRTAPAAGQTANQIAQVGQAAAVSLPPVQQLIANMNNMGTPAQQIQAVNAQLTRMGTNLNAIAGQIGNLPQGTAGGPATPIHFNALGQAMKGAAKEGSKFKQIMEDTAKTTQIALGPLSGIASRLTAFTALFIEASGAVVAFSLALVGTTGLIAGVIHTAQAVSQLVDQSRLLGIAFGDLQRLQFAAVQSGVSVQQFDKAMESLAQRVASASQGFGEARRSLTALGIEFRDFDQLTPKEQLFELARGFKEVTNETQRLQIAANLFSRANVDMVNLLKEGPEALQKLMDTADEFGVVLSDKVARDAEAAGDALDLLTLVVTKNLQRGFASLLPTLAQASIAMASLGPAIARNMDIISASVSGVLLGLFALAAALAVFGRTPVGLAVAGAFAVIGGAVIYATFHIDELIEKLEILNNWGRDNAFVEGLNRVNAALEKSIGTPGAFFDPEFILGLPSRLVNSALDGLGDSILSFFRDTGEEAGAQFSDGLEESMDDAEDGPLGEVIAFLKKLREDTEKALDFSNAFKNADQRGLQFLETIRSLQGELTALQDTTSRLTSGLSVAGIGREAQTFAQIRRAQQELERGGFDIDLQLKVPQIRQILEGTFAAMNEDLDDMTEEYNRQFGIVKKVAEIMNTDLTRNTEIQTGNLKAQLEILNREISLVSATSDIRDVEVAKLQKRNELLSAGAEAGTKTFNTAVAIAGKIAEQTIELQRQLATKRVLLELDQQIADANSITNALSNARSSGAANDLIRDFERAAAVRDRLAQTGQLELQELPNLDEIRQFMQSGDTSIFDRFGEKAEKIRQAVEKTGEALHQDVVRGVKVQNVAIQNTIDLLNSEFETLGLSTEERDVQLALEEKMLELRRLGLTIDEQAYQDALRLTEELVRREHAYKRQQRAIDDLSDTMKSGVQDIGQAFTDVFLDAEKGWKDLEQVAEDVMKRITDKVIELAIINPLINSAGLPGQKLPTFAGGGGTFLDTLSGIVSGIGGLFGGGASFGSGMSNTGSLIIGASGMLGGGVAKGGILSATGAIRKAAQGMVLKRPTLIPGSNFDVYAREAGRDEAVIPLTRMRSGDMGVALTLEDIMPWMERMQQPTVVHVNQRIMANDPNSFRSSLGQQARDARRAMERQFTRNG